MNKIQKLKELYKASSFKKLFYNPRGAIICEEVSENTNRMVFNMEYANITIDEFRARGTLVAEVINCLPWLLSIAEHQEAFENSYELGEKFLRKVGQLKDQEAISHDTSEKVADGTSSVDESGKWIGMHLQGTPKDFWQICCPCGVGVSFPCNKLPNVTTKHPCGHPDHYSICVGPSL